VESLLSFDKRAETFLETPAVGVAGRLLAATQSLAISRQFSSGAAIGPYIIESLVGAGGMGEVYKARDTRLDRFVALKFLPEQYATNPAMLERFRREGRAASALSHSNICTVYDTGEHQGRPFLVMELLEGRSLKNRIHGAALPLDGLLDFAVQIADALEAAHAKGIVHRDIKPANIFIAGRNQVKILDFGLTKLGPERGGSSGASTDNLITSPGATIGTVAYMSPEQVRGEEVDTRTDLFAFGVVLYEMGTGALPFQGNTTPMVFDAILHRDPLPPSSLNPKLPTALERIVLRALEKDRELRYQTASDLRAELKLLRREREPQRIPATGLNPPSSRSWPRRFTLALVLGGAGFAALGTYLLTRHGPDRPILRATFARLTNQPGPEIYPSLSPDGNLLVYQSRATGKWDIYLQRVGGSNAVNLTKDSREDDTQPMFSPTGERIAFRSERDDGGIFLMGATGENGKRLTDFGYNPAWSPDGKEIVCSTGSFLDRPEDRGTSRHGQLFRINVSTGQGRVIPAGDDAVQPHWSPHGYRIAYWGNVDRARRNLWTVAANGGDPVQVANGPHVDWNPVWSPDGRYLYFSSDRNGSMNLWRIRIDEVSGKTLADAEPVTTPSPYSGFLSFSRDGRNLAYAQQIRNWNTYKIPFDPEKEVTVGRPEPITRGSSEAVYPDVSTDGQWIAFTTRLTPEDVYVAKTDGSGLRQLTDDVVYTYAVPRWSPDGKQIAFFSNRSGRPQIWTIRPDGSNLQ
jgi:serine/threonine protein kinase